MIGIFLKYSDAILINFSYFYHRLVFILSIILYFCPLFWSLDLNPLPKPTMKGGPLTGLIKEGGPLIERFCNSKLKGGPLIERSTDRLSRMMFFYLFIFKYSNTSSL